MEFNLTTWQRVTLEQIIGELSGTVQMVSLGLPILRKLALTDEEKESVGWQVDQNGNAAWDVEKSDFRWKVALTDAELKLIRQAALGYRGWRIVNHVQIVDLFRELQIDYRIGE